MSAGRHLDFLLHEWPYDPEGPVVRLVKGRDGRDLLQMRVDLGILQMETVGRPDGAMPEGYPSLLDWLSQREVEDPEFEFDDDLCFEIEREFMQFYHRRMAWLRLQRYEQAIRDADHTLALMDLCRDHAPCEEWTMQHEQHRALVLFQRAQAAALEAVEQSRPHEAIREIDHALEGIAENYADLGWESEYESDELVLRLKHLRETIQSDFKIGKTLEDRLADAVAKEQYELAAKLRDEMARRENA